jgi:hypothetical protein
MNEEDLQPGIAAEVAGDVRSVMDRINDRRDSDEDVLTIDIPSWGGDLKAKYQVLHRDEIEKMIRRAQAQARGNGSDSGVDADAAFLVKACVGVVAVDPEDGETEIELAPGYTMDLARTLKPKYPRGHPQAGDPVPIKNERQLVVYMLRWNGVALASHGQTVARWMQTMKRPIEDPQ